MTKKHLQALALVLRMTRPEPGKSFADAAARVQWERDRNEIMNVCQAYNPRFNRSTFIEWTERS